MLTNPPRGRPSGAGWDATARVRVPQYRKRFARCRSARSGTWLRLDRLFVDLCVRQRAKELPHFLADRYRVFVGSESFIAIVEPCSDQPVRQIA